MDIELLLAREESSQVRRGIAKGEKLKPWSSVLKNRVSGCFFGIAQMVLFAPGFIILLAANQRQVQVCFFHRGFGSGHYIGGSEDAYLSRKWQVVCLVYTA